MKQCSVVKRTLHITSASKVGFHKGPFFARTTGFCKPNFLVLPLMSQKLGPQLVVQASKAENGTTEEVPLCLAQARLAWQVKEHSCARMCLNEITKRLFSGGGMVPMRGSEMLTPSPAFASYMHRELQPFSRDAFVTAQALGIVPIAFRKASSKYETGAGELRVSPYVPKFGTYTVTTCSVRGEQQFFFYWGGPCSDGACAWDRDTASCAFGERDDSVVIARDFGSNPNLDGTLTSNFATILDNIMFHNELIRGAVTAERIASNPPVFTSRNPAFDAQNATRDDHLGEAWFAGSAARQQHLAHEATFGGRPGECAPGEDPELGVATYERTTQERRGARLMLRAFERQTGLNAEEHFAVHGISACDDEEGAACVQARARNPETGYVMPWSSQFFIGASRSLVHQQMPQTRNDLVALTRNLQETICGVLSVPRDLIVSESNVRAGVENSENTMNKTVQFWADLLGDLLTRVYRHMFGQSDLAQELRMRVEQKRRMLQARYGPGLRGVPAQELVTERDLFEAVQQTSVTISFDLVPVTTAERLQLLYSEGIIPWKVYAESMLRVNNMPREFLAAEKAPAKREAASGKKRKKATNKVQDESDANDSEDDDEERGKRGGGENGKGFREGAGTGKAKKTTMASRAK